MAYNVLYPVALVSADTGAASFNSRAQEVINQDNLGFQFVWTGTVLGTFTIQVSLDHKEDSHGNIINVGTWTTITTSPAVVPAGSAGNGYIEVKECCAAYVRAVYTRTSGSGAINVYVMGKGV